MEVTTSQGGRYERMMRELAQAGRGDTAVHDVHVALAQMESEDANYYVDPTSGEHFFAFINALRAHLHLGPEPMAFAAAVAEGGGIHIRGDDADERPAPRGRSSRTRSVHHLSDGESDNDDPGIAFRSLRDEEEPFIDGLLPPPIHGAEITASAHIASGSKAKVKSAWVSASRSRKPATAWAKTTKGRKRVVRFRISTELRNSRALGGRGFYDLTDDAQASEVFPRGGTALNAAKASQEVVAYGGIPPEDILGIYDAVTVSVEVYQRIKAQIADAAGKPVIYEGREVYAAFRTRGKVKEVPQPRLLLKTSGPSLELVAAIREDLPGQPLNGHLLAYVLRQTRDVSEQIFLYTDIFRSMDIGSADEGSDADDEGRDMDERDGDGDDDDDDDVT